MDLWDLTKLLLRRWYFALPLLLVTLGMMVLTAQGVSPDYKAKGHLQMIPPPGLGKPVTPTGPQRPHNPWLDLGYQALGNAALLKVTDPPVLEQLAKNGYTSSVTVTLAERSPLLEIEAVGMSRAQATATVREVIKLLAEDIEAEQKQYGVAKEDTITSLILNDGENVEVVTSKVKRALVVAGGVGVLVTTAGTISLDALLRRRRRRDAPDGVEVPAPAKGPNGKSRLVRATSLAGPAGRTQADAAPADAAAAPAAAPAPVALAVEDATHVITPPGRPDEVPLQLEFKPAQQARNGTADTAKSARAEPIHEDADDTALPADATIVLPLPHAAGWPPWRDGKKNGR